MNYCVAAFFASILGVAYGAAIDDRSTSEVRVLDLSNVTFLNVENLQHILPSIDWVQFDPERFQATAEKLPTKISVKGGSTSGGRVRELLDALFNFAKPMLRKTEGYIPDLSETRIVSDDKTSPYNVLLSIHGIELDTSQINLDKVETDDSALTAKFSVVQPQNTVNAKQYEIEGTALGHDVSGKGAASINVENLCVSFDVHMAEAPTTKALSVTSMRLDATIGGVKVDFENLKIDGMTNKETKALLEKEAFERISASMKIAAQAYSGAEEFVNQQLIRGRTMEDVTKWLKANTVNSSSAPVPNIVVILLTMTSIAYSLGKQIF